MNKYISEIFSRLLMIIERHAHKKGYKKLESLSIYNQGVLLERRMGRLTSEKDYFFSNRFLEVVSTKGRVELYNLLLCKNLKNKPDKYFKPKFML